ncbi:hypothetical protein ABIE12_002182 [Serratia sp. 509]
MCWLLPHPNPLPQGEGAAPVMLLGTEANSWHPKRVASQAQGLAVALISAEQGLCFGLATLDTLD